MRAFKNKEQNEQSSRVAQYNKLPPYLFIFSRIFNLSSRKKNYAMRFFRRHSGSFRATLEFHQGCSNKIIKMQVSNLKSQQMCNRNYLDIKISGTTAAQAFLAAIFSAATGDWKSILWRRSLIRWNDLRIFIFAS